MGIDLKGMEGAGGEGKDGNVSMDTEPSPAGDDCAKGCCSSGDQAGDKVAKEDMEEEDVRTNGFSLSSQPPFSPFETG